MWVKNGFDIKLTTDDDTEVQRQKIEAAVKTVYPEGDVEVEFVEEIDREEPEDGESGEP